MSETQITRDYRWHLDPAGLGPGTVHECSPPTEDDEERGIVVYHIAHHEDGSWECDCPSRGECKHARYLRGLADDDDNDLLAPFPASTIKTSRKPWGTTQYAPKAQYVRRLIKDRRPFSWTVVERIRGKRGVLVVGQLVVGAEAYDAVGGGDWTRYRNDHRSKPNEIIDPINDEKKAESDAFKRAASYVGLGLYLYGGDEPQPDDTDRRAPSNGHPSASRRRSSDPPRGRRSDSPAVRTDASCSMCFGPISDAEIRYSQQHFRRDLCRDCQAEAASDDRTNGEPAPDYEGGY